MVRSLIALAIAASAATPALAVNWTQVNDYVWLDVDSISRRADGLTYFVAVHAGQDEDGRWTVPPWEMAPPTQSDEKAYDCVTGQFFAHQTVYPDGMTEDEFRAQYEEWDEEFGLMPRSEYYEAVNRLPTQLGPAGAPDKRGDLYLRICGTP